MTNLTRASNLETNHTPDWLTSVFVMLAILVANSVLIIGLLQAVSWTACALLVLTGVALSGGILYTVVTMQRLGKEQ